MGHRETHCQHCMQAQRIARAVFRSGGLFETVLPYLIWSPSLKKVLPYYTFMSQGTIYRGPTGNRFTGFVRGQMYEMLGGGGGIMYFGTAHKYIIVHHLNNWKDCTSVGYTPIVWVIIYILLWLSCTVQASQCQHGEPQGGRLHRGQAGGHNL